MGANTQPLDHSWMTAVSQLDHSWPQLYHLLLVEELHLLVPVLDALHGGGRGWSSLLSFMGLINQAVGLLHLHSTFNMSMFVQFIGVPITISPYSSFHASTSYSFAHNSPCSYFRGRFSCSSLHADISIVMFSYSSFHPVVSISLFRKIPSMQLFTNPFPGKHIHILSMLQCFMQ